MGITNMETRITAVRNLVGRHTIIFQASPVVDCEFRAYLPIVRKVSSQFILSPFRVLRAQFIESSEFTGTSVSFHPVQYLRIFGDGSRPLKRRRLIIQVIKPFIQPQTYIMVTDFLFQLRG